MRKKIGIFLVSMLLVILTFSSVKIINIETSEAALSVGVTPIAHWHFDEGSGTTAYDSSGNNYHITIYGASWTVGVSGSCLDFDHDYALVTNFNRNVYACNVWLKPDVTITKYSGAPGPGNSIAFLRFFDKYDFALGDCTSLVDDETITIVQGAPPEPEPRTAVLDQDITYFKWHMITITWNNGLGRYDIYFDGFKKPVVSSAGGHSDLIYCDDFQINDANSVFNGKIDEISIYNYPLDENEILALYNEYANDPPNKPILLGQTLGRVGESYVYNAVTTDPDGDQLEYWYDWDDGQTSGWLGMYNSGENCEKSHRWDVEGSYNLKVKARDVYGVESEWSNTLSVSMPRNRVINNPLFTKFMDGFIERFPLFARLLKL